jgi:NTE family protein
MGGLVAALYAIGLSPLEIEAIAIKYTSIREMINFVDRTPKRRGLIVGHRFRSFLSKIIDPSIDIRDARIPLALNGVDLISSAEISLTQGKLLDAVMATIAVPGFFAPVQIGGFSLVDGGTLNNLPISQIHQFDPEVLLAVDVHPDTTKEIPWHFAEDKPKFPIPVPSFFLDYYRSIQIMMSRINENNLAQDPPDLLLRPNMPSEITLFYGYQRAAQIIASGEKTTQEHLAEIKSALF